MTLTPDLPTQEDGFKCGDYTARARARIRRRAESGAALAAGERAIMDLSYAIDSLAAAFEVRCKPANTQRGPLTQMFCSNCGSDQRYAPTGQCGNCGAQWVGITEAELMERAAPSHHLKSDVEFRADLRSSLVRLGAYAGKRYASQDATSAAHEFADAALEVIDALISRQHTIKETT